ncbi:MAG TPA: TIGR02281 family clan AA aspartic protease [Sphingomicrobium sp.]|nr:TIGR02281 family clan AA aspartic protease [Sphingomicrobium sp.]
MLRTYLIALVLIGFAATLVSHLPGAASQARSKTLMIDNKDSANPTGEGGDTKNGEVRKLDDGVELTRDENGYFYADVKINGATVHMLVDTGATVIALSRDDARMAGIATSIGMNDVVGQGADGAVKGEEVVLDRVTLGNRSAEKLPAIVLNNGGQSLLGESFLSKFASVKIEGNRMVLQ